MRIIAGRYRRRQLFANPGKTTRPITDRAKEQLFENLGGELKLERVADIFSGTGSMGLEALSRGATHCVFIELDRKAHELLEQNVEKVGIEADVLCWRTDVLRCSFLPKGREELTPYELIFYDPPFPMLKDLKAGSPMFRSLERLARPGVSSDDCILILRVPPRTEAEVPPEWSLQWSLKPAGMEILVFRKTEFVTPAE